MKLMMWIALAKRLFTAINRTVSVIFRPVNPERCVSEGDVPRGVDPNPLISFYSSLILGLAIRARDGTSRKLCWQARRRNGVVGCADCFRTAFPQSGPTAQALRPNAPTSRPMTLRTVSSTSTERHLVEELVRP